MKFLEEKDIKICALQETKLHAKSREISTPNFTLVRADRGKDTGGGLAFLVHKSIQFHRLPNNNNDPHIECLAIKINTTTIVNLYIPPASSCGQGYKPELAPYLQHKDSIVVGDFNAHDELWFSQMQDTRGAMFAEEIGNSNLGCLNEDSHTRLPSNGEPSSPDVSLASLSLLPYTSWKVETTLNSDHLPIIIAIKTEIQPQRSENITYINFKKADWEKFENETEKEFDKLPSPSDIYKGEKTFRAILNKVSKLTIPHGRIKDILSEVPTEAVIKMKERDRLRESDPLSPEINQLNKDINNCITNHKREKWRETVSEKMTSTKLFKLIKHLNGGNCKASENEGIRFKGKYITTPKKIANAFNKQYTSIVRHISSKTARSTNKNLKKNNLNTASTFTADQTKAAISKSKASKALGPDGISTVHLKHLGPRGIIFLTELFNLSMKTSQIPAIWKQSTIIPLLKPKKPADESNSYRPVSLLCPAIKVLERLILPTLTDHLPVPPVQHGFRKNHSTVTALNDFNQAIADGFNQKKPAGRTILLQLDLSKAFDMVSHEKLLADLNKTSLPDHLKRWYGSYLNGRQSRVKFRNATSTSRNTRTGVPQGAVTSPILFNFYVHNLPPPPPGVVVVQYADDLSVYMVGTDLDSMTETINGYATSLTDFLSERELLVSPEKSTVTLFTPASSEMNIHPQVYVQGTLVKLEQRPVLLGVKFDTMYTFTPHIKDAAAKAKAKVNVLKALAGSTWGQEKETLVTAYKTVVRSTLEYANPIWTPAIKPTNWERLQRVQNHGLRVATGCLNMASVDHLHQETNVLPVRPHCEMMTRQFISSAHLPEHPANKHLNKPRPPRDMKKTNLIYEEQVARKYNNLNPTKEAHKGVIKALHTESVQKVIQDYPPNRVLNAPPPQINPSETALGRTARSRLTRLRSGFCRSLNNYMARIDQTIVDSCPLCNQSPHDAAHLFQCAENPTELTVRDLWTKPTEVALFLNLDDSYEA